MEGTNRIETLARYQNDERIDRSERAAHLVPALLCAVAFRCGKMQSNLVLLSDD